MVAGSRLLMIVREEEERLREDQGAEAGLDPGDPKDQGLGPGARGAGQGLEVGKRAGPGASLALSLEARLG